MPATGVQRVIVIAAAAVALVAALSISARSLPAAAQGGPASQPRPQPTSNPTALQLAALQQRQLDALNRGDVAGVMATFGDDPVLEGLGLCRPAPCAGRAAVEREITREVAAGTRIARTSVQATPPSVAGEATITSIGVQAAGVQRILASFVARVQGERIAAVRWTLDTRDAQTAAALAAPSGAGREAVLLLADPRPCIPEPGQQVCDAVRSALWNGEAAAWAARGVTDPDARFNETVVFRVRAGDPAAISAIARLLGAPYLKITRLRFAGTPPGQQDEFIAITNLGGGAQDLAGWTVRSPARAAVAPLPAGLALAPGESCRVYTGPPGSGSCGSASFAARDVWPDDEGEAVLFFDALNLPGDDARYRAGPGAPPPPPALQIDTTGILLP